jgi:hypothetical protein
MKSGANVIQPRRREFHYGVQLPLIGAVRDE